MHIISAWGRLVCDYFRCITTSGFGDYMYFVYLSGNVGTHDGVDSDINRRTGLARTVFQMLKKVWSSTHISNTTKLKVYDTMVLSVLMYNHETWTLKQTQESRLWVFEMSCFRRIAEVTRRDRIRNKEVCDRVHLLQDVANRIQQRRMQYFGHVQRMDHARHPKLALTDMCMGQKDKEDPRKDG